MSAAFPPEALPAGLDVAAVLARAGIPADAAVECHVVKDRPGRRRAVFVGPSRLVDGHREVEGGALFKVMDPARIVRLVERYEALARALPVAASPESALPRVPRLLAADVAAGWAALEAFPGASLASWADGDAREAELAAAGRALAALESDSGAAAAWPGGRWTVAREAERLSEVWAGIGAEPPAWTGDLIRALDAIEGSTPVPAHRDLNEEQIVAQSPSSRRAPAGWVDWDEACLAPAGLDLGNLEAHETLRRARQGGAPGSGLPDGSHAGPGIATQAYLEAGGRVPPAALAAWEAMACVRLAGLVLGRTNTPRGLRNPEWVPAAAGSLPAPEALAASLLAAARARTARGHAELG